MEQTAEQIELANMIEPCVDCGRRVNYSPEQAATMLERAAREPVCRDVLRLGHRCAVCAVAREHAGAERSHARSVERMLRDTVDKGLFSREALAHTFAESNREYERQNIDAWAQGRVWTFSSPNLWVCGPKGTGKTYLCECVISGVLVQGITAAAISAVEINRAGPQFKAAEMMIPYRRVQVLLLDDLDTPAWCASGIDLLRDLLDYRYRAKMKTLVTANSTGARFAERIRELRSDNPAVGGAMMERLLPIDVLQMGGPSLRR